MIHLRLFLLALAGASAVARLSALTLTAPGLAATENFDSLGLVAGSTLPAGWELNETGSSANTAYGVGNGSSSTGNTYSFGATGDSDRALGALRTSGVASMFGTVIVNLTGTTLTGLGFEYTGEQWRLGATGRTDRLDFSYSLDATSLLDGTWVDFDPLDFLSPLTTGATGAVDGNLPENRTTLSQTLDGFALAPGAGLWIRWTDFDATGSDDGLAIDDFAVRGIAATPPVPVPAAVPESLPTGPVAALLLAGLAVSRRWRGRGRLG